MIANAKTPEEKAKAEAMKPYPTKPHPVTYYSSVEPGLFESVINKYMSNYHGADHSEKLGPDFELEPASAVQPASSVVGE